MKKSDKIRIGLAVLTSVLAIAILIANRLKTDDEKARRNDIERMKQELAATAGESGLSIASAQTASTSSGMPQDAGTQLTIPSADPASSAASAASRMTENTPASAAAGKGNTAAFPQDVSGNSLYRCDPPAETGRVRAGTPATAKSVLQEMRGYWETIGLPALRDLWHLDRYTALSAYLSAHPEIPYFYEGDTDASGTPSGHGIAVYSGNRYYLGDWVNGRREGAGEWYQFYPESMHDVVRMHEYTGGWKNDLPDGDDGIDLYEYDTQYMDDDSLYPQNVIGHFTEGLYDGDMYVILADTRGNTHEWYGKCVRGTWQVIDRPDADGRIPVLFNGEDPGDRISMWPKYASGYGVYHVR